MSDDSTMRGVFDGTLQSAAEYDPFGEPIVTPVGTPYGFTGELTDGSGLVYLRARYLAPALGTFASRDPWRGSASAPRTGNGYAWVEGNVVNRVDASGMTAGIAACENSAPLIEAMTITTLTAGGASAVESAAIPGNLSPSYSIQAPPVWYFRIDPLRAISQAEGGAYAPDTNPIGGLGGIAAIGAAALGTALLLRLGLQSQGAPGSWGPTPNVSTVITLPEYGPRLPSGSRSVEHNDLLEFLDQFDWGLTLAETDSEAASTQGTRTSPLDECIDDCKDLMSGEEGFGRCIDHCRSTTRKPYWQCREECVAQLARLLLRCEERCYDLFG